MFRTDIPAGGGGGSVHRSIGIFTSRGHAQSILRNLQTPGPGPGKQGAGERAAGTGRKGGGSARRTAARENYFFSLKYAETCQFQGKINITLRFTEIAI